MGTELELRGAKDTVLVVEMPPTDDGDKQGYDDLPPQRRAECFNQLARHPLSHSTFDLFRKHDKQARRPSESELAERIAQHPDWQRTIYEEQRRQWLRYGQSQPGIWGPVEKGRIEREVEALLKEYCAPLGFSSITLAGVLHLLKIELGRTLKPLGHKWLPCTNGMLHLPTMALKHYTAGRYCTWCVPYAYDPDATCQPILGFLDEALQGDKAAIKTVQAYLKAVVQRRVDLQKFIELIGGGGTGKGTVIRLTQAMIGYHNSCITTLRTLESSRFETHMIIGKQLVVISDAERWVGAVGQLKSITGGDAIRVERKHHDPANYTPEAMVMVAANEAIQCPDYTSGLSRRRITIEFQYKPPEEQVRDLLIFQQDQPQGELAAYLPGLLNWVLSMSDAEMVIHLRRQDATSVSRMRVANLLATNGMAAWADEFLVAEPDLEQKTYVGVAREYREYHDTFGYTRLEHTDTWLYASYCDYMATTRQSPVAMQRFSHLLEDLCRKQLNMSQVKKEARDAKGVPFIGIRLRTPADTAPGLVYQQLCPGSLELQGTVEDDVDGSLGSVDVDGNVSFPKIIHRNNRRGGGGRRHMSKEKVVAKKSTSSIGSTLARVSPAQASTRSTLPRVHGHRPGPMRNGVSHGQKKLPARP